MSDMRYALTKVTEMTYEEALEKVPGLLSEEGFGILTEIDVTATLKKKLDVDFRKYKILGACNPNLAFRALQAEIDIGTLLPCNVIIYENDDAKAVVSIMNPSTMRDITGNQGIADVADEARLRLSRVLDKT